MQPSEPKMSAKKPDLDEATIDVVKRMLEMPPKPHGDMKVDRPASTKKRGPKKDRAASAKARNA